MIELAPHHKTGLNLASPVMIASGFCGYGNAYSGLIELSHFSAVVTQPVTLRPQRGTPQPRLVETKSGIILNTGRQNPGVKKVLHTYSKVWARLDTQIIAHLPADDPPDLMRTARALTTGAVIKGEPVLAAIELGIPHYAHPADVEQWVAAIRDGSELPLLVKLPPGRLLEMAEAAVNAYADALVIGTPPMAAAYSQTHKTTVSGLLFGSILHQLTLHNLQLVTDFELPVIAAGGIHTYSDVEVFLQAGATAVQVNSLLLVDPKQAEEIAQNIETGTLS